jgi:hypothetical protein
VDLFRLLQRGESREWIAVKRVGLPGVVVPLAVLIANDLHRYNGAVVAHFVGGCDGFVELPIREDGELDRPREFVVPKHLHLIIARIILQQMPAGSCAEAIGARLARINRQMSKTLREMRYRI